MLMCRLTSFLLIAHASMYAQPREFPYARNKSDWILIPTAIATTITADYLYKRRDFEMSVEEIQQLNRTSINSFDRPATYNWSRSAANFSNVPYSVLPILPIAFGVPLIKHKQWSNALTLGVIYVEVLFFTKNITGITKSLAQRRRPYLYNTQFTPEERFKLQETSPDPYSSFISGHSSVSFAFAVLLSKTYTDIYGKNTWSKIVWGTSLSFAAAAAYARVEAGVHYPTDVMAGALIGSAIGYIIPTLHKTKTEKLSIHVIPGNFLLTYKL
jgi:membrane-associated phospholipid phosphatase